MNPSIAYALFCRGKNTYEIALREGRTEAEVVEALVRYREMRDGGVAEQQAMEVRPQEEVRLAAGR